MADITVTNAPGLALQNARDIVADYEDARAAASLDPDFAAEKRNRAHDIRAGCKDADPDVALVHAAIGPLNDLVAASHAVRVTLAWCVEQAESIMAITSGCCTTHGDPGGGLEISNTLASDIAVNLQMAAELLEKEPRT